MKKTNVKNIKRGDFVKLVRKGQPTSDVYVRGEYCKYSKAFELTSWFNINKIIYRKGKTECFADFEF